MSSNYRNRVSAQSAAGESSLFRKAEEKLQELERLVDELIKPTPHESKVEACMAAVGLRYSIDPILRMNEVLNTLNEVRCGQKDKEL